ncbi:MAG: hypothetical protein EOP05_14150 [Proteobacteria bacterium]|nr:MAG: hypothetical protein EOP05_14150 [Pseudomonadota bacterium]
MLPPRYLLIIVVPILLVTYTNCGQFQQGVDLAKNLSSNCVAKIRETAKVNFSSTVCADMTAFECDRRVFKPGANAGTTTKHECVRSPAGEDSCVKVTTYTFDTENARKEAGPGAFDSGGDYNHEEVQCINKMVTRQNISVVNSDAPTLEEALPEAVSLCLEKGAK